MRKTAPLLASVAVALLLTCGVSVLVVVQPAEAAFPGTNGKIAFERQARIWVKFPRLGAEERKLRDDAVLDRDAAFSPDGSRVAFVRSNEIYVTNADSMGAPRRLTNDSLLDSHPAWSHDGTKIVFQRRGTDNQYNIWTMNSDGTQQAQLTSTGGVSVPDWLVPVPGAPDGKILYKGAGRELWTMNPDGSGKAQIDYTCPTVNGGICDNAVGDPTFSPNGSEIAAEYFGDIFVISAGGGAARVILGTMEDGYPGQELDPAWSPDGTKIAFEHNGNVAGGASNIYVANADGSSTQPTQLTSLGGINPDWQPIPVCTKTVNADNDPLTGTIGKDVLCGDNRNNTINGAGGNDIILAKGGADNLTGALGNDTLNGGPGTDTVLYLGSTAVKASLTTEFATGVGSDVLLGVENLTGSGANDRLTGSAVANTLVGGAGADSMSALAGNDTLNSRGRVNGNDTLSGGPGTDTKITDATEKPMVGFP
jgi:Ca2+-binding RTX toxin-like protein